MMIQLNSVTCLAVVFHLKQICTVAEQEKIEKVEESIVRTFCIHHIIQGFLRTAAISKKSMPIKLLQGMSSKNKKACLNLLKHEQLTAKTLLMYVREIRVTLLVLVKQY